MRRKSDAATVSELLEECISHLQEPFKHGEIMRWFRKHHPEVNEATVTAQVEAATEHPLRERRFGSPPPLLVRVHRGTYRRYTGLGAAPTELAGATVVLLVAGGQRTRMRPAAARDLYRGSLFSHARDYAEATGRPWYVLSSRFGAVAPDTVLGPVEGRLADRSMAYLDAWASWVAAHLAEDLGELGGTCFELHANDSYVAALRDRLTALGATVTEPVAAMGREDRLAWYDARVARPSPAEEPVQELSEEMLLGVVEAVGDADAAVTVAEIEAAPPDKLGQPGLYSWFVDADGALELSAGAGHVVRAGLVYAGLAGGSRKSAGTRVADTLGGRLLEVHLASNSRVSTFRHTLAAVLRPVHGWDTVDEMALTHWMRQHLRIVTVPVTDPDIFDLVETAVLGALDPPLNLGKVPRTPLRLRLIELRRAV
jgi:hypothetical protein